jgi:hypothetical protein
MTRGEIQTFLRRKILLLSLENKENSNGRGGYRETVCESEVLILLTEEWMEISFILKNQKKIEGKIGKFYASAF